MTRANWSFSNWLRAKVILPVMLDFIQNAFLSVFPAESPLGTVAVHLERTTSGFVKKIADLVNYKNKSTARICRFEGFELFICHIPITPVSYTSKAYQRSKSWLNLRQAGYVVL